MLNNDSYNFLINQNIDMQKNLGCVLLENQKGEFISNRGEHIKPHYVDV